MTDFPERSAELHRKLRQLSESVKGPGTNALNAQGCASALLTRRTQPQPATERSRHPLLLLWSPPDWGPTEGFRNGPPGFEISFDRSRFRQAWAIVFLSPTLGRGLPILPRIEGQRWIGWSLESEAIYTQSRDPAIRGHLDGFLSHRRDDEFPSLYVKRAHRQELRRPAVEKTEPAPAVFVNSSPLQSNSRLELARDLGLHFPIDRYGKLYPNRVFEGPDLGRETKLRTLARYRFTLAFENSTTPDYVTEKIYDALIAGSVPIYLGTPAIRDYLPSEHCALLVEDYPDTASLARHVLALCNDEAAYQELLDWKDRPFRPEFVELVERYDEDPFLRIARWLSGPGAEAND